MAEHPRIQFSRASGPVRPARGLSAPARLSFVAPAMPPAARRMGPGLATTLGLMGLLTAIGVAGVLTGRVPLPHAVAPGDLVTDVAPAARPGAAVDRAAVRPGADPRPAAVVPDRPPAPRAPAGLPRLGEPLPAPEREAPAAPGLDAASGLAVASSLRPVPRPGLQQAARPEPAPEAEPADAEEAVVAALDSSPRPRPRPESLLAASTAPTRSTPPARAEPDRVDRVAARVDPGSARPGAAAESCPRRLAARIPDRPRGAQGGQRIADRVGPLSGSARDRALAQEVLAGNVPGFLRDLTPVTVSGRRGDGRQVSVTFCVTPDYLAVGSDSDFFRVPLGLPAAAMVADRLGFLLPTTRMVDVIYQQAGVRLAPQPMAPGAQMTTTQYFWAHHQKVEGQLGGRAGSLTAGQKKDIVLSNRLRSRPGRIAIYGWHRPNGTPIQPLSTVHGAYYADYSHGARLVSRTAYVNGAPVPLADILQDPAYAGFLSDEGPIEAPERLMAALYR